MFERELVGSAEDTLGLRFGAYRVTRLLGIGGMGVVYLAERADGKFTQQVALKVVQTGVGATARERFEHERRILARLVHPNIAALHDGGELPDGQAFYTMEYVDGVPITLYCVEAALRRRAARAPAAQGRRRRSRSPIATSSCIATSSRRTSSSPTTAR